MSDALPSVRLEAVRKVYGRRHLALLGLDLELTRGEVALLVGPNGAGKSTLLSVLSTLVRPTSGQVRFGALPQHKARRQLRHQIGIVGHAPMLYGHLTVVENLKFFASLYGLPEPDQEVAGAIERLELGDFASRPVAELSRGMTQRAALARALLARPGLLLLDEPFAGLDQQAVQLLRRELAAGHEERITVVVTHELEAAEGIATRMVVLEAGQLAADIAGDALAGRPLGEVYREALA